MRNPIPVSARRLRNRTVRTYDRLIPGACLFPFFEPAGSVRFIMLLTPESDQIHLLPWDPGLVRVPLWGPMLLTGTSTPALRGIADEQIETIQSLWHYDPSWMLNETPWAAHRLGALLKATNCANQFKRKVRRLYYRRDLSRLTWVMISTGGQILVRPWRASLLPALETVTVRSGAAAPQARLCSSRTPLPTPAWHFDPIWTSWTKGQTLNAE